MSREYASSTIFDNKKYISELDDKILLEKSLMSQTENERYLKRSIINYSLKIYLF
jgi:hypothetical protein